MVSLGPKLEYSLIAVFLVDYLKRLTTVTCLLYALDFTKLFSVSLNGITFTNAHQGSRRDVRNFPLLRSLFSSSLD